MFSNMARTKIKSRSSAPGRVSNSGGSRGSSRPTKSWFYEVTGKPKHSQDFTTESRPVDSRGRAIDAAYLHRTRPRAAKPGRPSLNGKPAASPRINLRVTPQLLKQAERVARRKNMSVSQLTRAALAKEVARLGR